VSLLEIHGRDLLKKISEQPNDCRGYTQRQIAEETGVQEPVVSLVLRAASDNGLLRRGMGRRRSLVVTPRGLEWMVTAPPDDSIERVVTPAKRRRILVACLKSGRWQRGLEVSAAVSKRHLPIMLKWLHEQKHIYKSTLGWKTSPAGREWLESVGVQTSPPPKTRQCLMCLEVASEGRWYCEYHCEFRVTLFRTNSDGSYCPGASAGDI